MQSRGAEKISACSGEPGFVLLKEDALLRVRVRVQVRERVQ